MSRTNRRRFIQATSAAGASFLIMGTRASGNAIGANDRLRIAVAGLNGRGQSHVHGWSEQENVEIAYVIDPDRNVLNRMLKRLESETEGKFNCKGTADVREALADKSVDAISIATPNHWHSLMTIWAAQAGNN